MAVTALRYPSAKTKLWLLGWSHTHVKMRAFQRFNFYRCCPADNGIESTFARCATEPCTKRNVSPTKPRWQ